MCILKKSIAAVDSILEKRKEKYKYYKKNIGNIKGIRLFDRNLEASSNYAYFPLLIENDCHETRDRLYDKLKENGIYARKYFYPLTSDEVCFKNKYKNEQLGCARELARKVLVIPFYAELELDNIDRIVCLLK